MDQPPSSISGLISRQAASHGTDTIMRTKHRGIWKAITWRQLDERRQDIGKALLTADFGRGAVVAIISETRPEAVYADLAILGCGAVSVAIDPDEETERVFHLLSSSGSRLAFVENEQQLDKVLTIRHRCPALSRIVVFDMKGLRDFADAHCISLSAFIETGGAPDWTSVERSIAADQPAIIQFPRGEGAGTGRTLSHGDLMHMIGIARARLPIQVHDERLAVLRLSDITERIWGLYLALATRCISNYPEGPVTMIENLRELQPTILGADADVWEALHGLAVSRAKAATTAQRLAYDWALRAGRLGASTHRFADLLVLQAVRREFGLSKLRFTYVGGASVPPGALDWARSLGIRIQRVDDTTTGYDRLDERYQALMQTAYA